MSLAVTTTKANCHGTLHLYSAGKQSFMTDTQGYLPTTKQIYAWVLSPGVITTCFIRDVFQMKSCEEQGMDFYWLGSVPCRTVCIIGMVVGIQMVNKRITYTIDDGTDVIDCTHLLRPAAVKDIPNSSKTRPSTATLFEPSPDPVPVGSVGSLMKITGRVLARWNTRHIVVDEISVCASFNEELSHRSTVRNLRQTVYMRREPFRIPTRCDPEASAQSSSTATKNGSPKRRAFDSSPPSSPISASNAHPDTDSKLAVDCTDTDIQHQSPPRLRHPSRLRSSALTGNSFRIYLKHFMDNHLAPVDIYTNNQSASMYSRIPPSKPTPNPISDPPLSTIGGDNSDSQIRGFTLSYLRRVPELAQMAYRVVKAEAKRRAHAELYTSKEPQMQLPSSRTSSKSSNSLKGKLSREGHAARMKRLFVWAIQQLVGEGSVIIWTGPTYPLPSTSRTTTEDLASHLWKMESTVSTLTEQSMFSAASADSQIVNGRALDEYLSGPNPSEEAYLSLSPSLLASEVERVVARLNSRPIVPGVTSYGAASRGASAAAILANLQKDDLWRRLGLWQVTDALEFLREGRRARDAGRGRWEIFHDPCA